MLKLKIAFLDQKSFCESEHKYLVQEKITFFRNENLGHSLLGKNGTKIENFPKILN